MAQTPEKISGYVQGATIGMLAAIAMYFSNAQTNVGPQLFAAVLLYFSALVYSRSPHTLAVLVFVLIALIILNPFGVSTIYYGPSGFTVGKITNGRIHNSRPQPGFQAFSGGYRSRPPQ